MTVISLVEIIWCYQLSKFNVILFFVLSVHMQLDGINSLLMVEHSPSLPLVSKSPTLILGMDVSHGSPGRSDVPSIAAVTFYLLNCPLHAIVFPINFTTAYSTFS